MLAYSSIAQAGYILAGFVVVTPLGIQAVALLPRRLPAGEHGRVRGRDAARARDRRGDDSPRSRARRAAPAAALAMTLSMLSLAGIPATAGFMGKFRLIEATADGGYTWLGIVIVIGSMISLAYYLPVVATMWRDEAQPARRPARDRSRHRPRRRSPARRPAERPARRLEIQLVALVMRRRDPRLRHRPAAAVQPRPARRRGHPRAALAAPLRGIGHTSRRAHLRQGRLRASAPRRARRRRASGPVKGDAIAHRAGHPAEVPREHPRRPAPRRARRAASAAPRAATGSPGPPSEITVADIMRAVEGPLASSAASGPRTRLRRRGRAAAAASGSPCARACAASLEQRHARRPRGRQAAARGRRALADDPEAWVTR